MRRFLGALFLIVAFIGGSWSPGIRNSNVYAANEQQQPAEISKIHIENNVKSTKNKSLQIVFKTSQPFQYRLKALSANKIAMQLIQATLSPSIERGPLLAGQSIEIDKNPWIQSAIVYKFKITNHGSSSTLSDEVPPLRPSGCKATAEYFISRAPGRTLKGGDLTSESQTWEEIQFIGPNLGKKKITIQQSSQNDLHPDSSNQTVAINYIAQTPALPAPKLSGALQNDELQALSPIARPEIIPVTPDTSQNNGLAPIQFTVLNTGQKITVPVVGDPEPLNTFGSSQLSALQPEIPISFRAEKLMSQSLSLYRTGKVDMARLKISQALQTDPKNPLLYAALGELLITRPAFTDAESAFEKALQYSKVSANRLYLLERASQASYEALKADRTPEHYSQCLHSLLSLMNQYPEAAEQSGLFQLTLGLLFEEMGETEKATHYLLTANHILPGSADILYDLGLVYELQGRNDEARQYYLRAQEINPSSEDIFQAVRRVKGYGS